MPVIGDDPTDVESFVAAVSLIGRDINNIVLDSLDDS